MSEYIITDMSLSAIATPNLQMVKHSGHIEMICSESYLCDSYPEIVRCRDCKKCNVGWCLHFNNIVKPNGYCAWGKKEV